MKDRINIHDVQPEAIKAMLEVERYLSDSALDVSLKELVKVRVSQNNGCAYCIAMHTKFALNRGESQERLFELAAWRESRMFSEQEKVVLQLADEVTDISEQGLSDHTYEGALHALGETALAQAIVQIAAINAWNRIAIATRMK